MGGIDLTDQLLQSYFVEKKKLFQHILNTAFLNSTIIHRENTGIKIAQLSYQVQLVKALFVKHSSATDFKVPG
jgi:hypothetical protein